MARLSFFTDPENPTPLVASEVSPQAVAQMDVQTQYDTFQETGGLPPARITDTDPKNTVPLHKIIPEFQELPEPETHGLERFSTSTQNEMLHEIRKPVSNATMLRLGSVAIASLVAQFGGSAEVDKSAMAGFNQAFNRGELAESIVVEATVDGDNLVPKNILNGLATLTGLGQLKDRGEGAATPVIVRMVNKQGKPVHVDRLPTVPAGLKFNEQTLPVTTPALAQPPQVVPMAESTTEDTFQSQSAFYTNIGNYAESNHGLTPKPTNDSKEADKPLAEKSLDVGYGHKVKDDEIASKRIHGIPFIDDMGNFIELTQKDIEYILHADMEAESQLARRAGWDEKLKAKGSSWEQLSQPYRNVLTSLAYNVGGSKAGNDWNAILDAAISEDVSAFAKQARRNDNGKKTAGMDNRVLKELYYAGLITDATEVADELPLADANQAGIPAGNPAT